MLLIRFTTTKILTLKQEQLIKERVGQLTKDKNTIIHIEDNQVMYLDCQEIECMMIECQCHKTNNIKEFSQLLMKEIETITEIPISRQYMTVKFFDLCIEVEK